MKLRRPARQLSRNPAPLTALFSSPVESADLGWPTMSVSMLGARLGRAISGRVRGPSRGPSRGSGRGLSGPSVPPALRLQGHTYPGDAWTNVTPRILSLVERRLHRQPSHPLNLVSRRIVRHMYRRFPAHRGLPLFSVHDDLSPVVSLAQNFDSLLVPADHPCRNRSDSYFLNRHHMLRAHTSAHQSELIRMGLDNFLVIGDVYRRDEVDARHYPVFHQVEAVRLLDEAGLTRVCATAQPISLFEAGSRTADQQACHTLAATRCLAAELQECLLSLTRDLFGPDIEYRWVDGYFPFTHPSWELEIKFQDRWLEVLGCGIMEQELLHRAGVQDKMGWAFGLGLERLAMKLYAIPDIRIFWSRDSGVLSQFQTDDIDREIEFQAVSKYPQCVNDISFWLPASEAEFSSLDFYDLVRSVGGDLVEQVQLVDTFFHAPKQKLSHCYRIIYRSMDRTLTQDEVNEVHQAIERTARDQLDVEIR